MVVEPAATNVTLPVDSLTVATEGSEEVYASVRPAGVVVAVGEVKASPILASALFEAKVTVASPLLMVNSVVIPSAGNI